MKIHEIEADNILAIKSVRIRMDKPVAFIAGANGTLKSSIYDAINSAITRAPMREVVEKKDYQMLVHDGAKAGGALVTMVAVGDDEPLSFGFNMPKGNFTGDEVSESMRVSLQGQRFAQMSVNERLAFLRDLTGIRPKKSVIGPMLLELGANPVLVDEVLTMLSGGFDEASKYAAERASDAKREWCRTTARKAYGKDIAETWLAEVPEAPNVDLEQMRQQMVAYANAGNLLNQSIGAIRQSVAQVKADADTRASLSASAARVPDLTDQLARAKVELAEYQPKVEALRERAKGTARVGLVHDMMRLIVGEPAANLTKERATAHAKVMAAYAKEYGPLPDAGKVDLEAQADLPKYEAGLTVLANRVTNLERDLAKATSDKSKYDVLAPAEAAPDDAAELAEAEQALADNTASSTALANQINAAQATLQEIEGAGKRNTDAAGHHKTVKEWTAIADALAPAGIPHQMLLKALAPVNAKLWQASQDTGWPRVVIRDDMSIMFGDRLYQLQSKSMKWRADAMIAEVTADISGIRILMLDEYDILDMQGRAELLEWIDILVDEGDMESVLIFGTLREPPKGLPESFAPYWVADGVIVA